MSETIVKKQERKKELLLEKLTKTPIVQAVCQKVGIDRATYYRWKKEDLVFAGKAEQALKEGCLFINDMAESQLISAIKDKHMTAIIFWLKNHHKSYMQPNRDLNDKINKLFDW